MSSEPGFEPLLRFLGQRAITIAEANAKYPRGRKPTPSDRVTVLQGGKGHPPSALVPVDARSAATQTRFQECIGGGAGDEDQVFPKAIDVLRIRYLKEDVRLIHGPATVESAGAHDDLVGPGDRRMKRLIVCQGMMVDQRAKAGLPGEREGRSEGHESCRPGDPGVPARHHVAGSSSCQRLRRQRSIRFRTARRSPSLSSQRQLAAAKRPPATRP